MRQFAKRLISETDGAAAPTIALSLVALIAAGGIAFDYARMASMDTELQNAADQAVLAAASQLDGEIGACARAAAAAANMITNHTLMANEAGNSTNSVINIQEEGTCDDSGLIRFYQDPEKNTAATDVTNAKFVEVEVDPREAFFAFTPVVAAFSSGAFSATAFAGLGEAICRVPPLMMCNPDENGDPDFTLANYISKGIRLVANDGGGNYGGGNFGFLAVGQGNGASALAQVLGRNGDPGDCASGSTVTTEPGNMVSLRDALNTRFDMYQNGLNQACGSDGSLCPPSANSRKDLLRRGTNSSACGFVTGVGGQGWHYPNTNMYSTVLTSDRLLTDAEADTVRPMGYPRDTCHAWSITGDCDEGIIGTGEWDRYAYFRSHRGLNYPEATSRAAVDAFMNTTFGTTTPTRYQVYAWEMDNAATRLRTVDLGSNVTATGAPVCAPGLGVTPGPNQIDRRVLSVAVINCDAEGVQGRTEGVEVAKWIDIFLVEPSVARPNRTENSDVYVEIKGETANAGGSNFQVVRKSVPYLIE